MTRRPKGQVPFESPHPGREWLPDTPGHRQKSGHKGARVVVNKEQKEELDRQIDRLRAEIVSSGENKG